MNEVLEVWLFILRWCWWLCAYMGHDHPKDFTDKTRLCWNTQRGIICINRNYKIGNERNTNIYSWKYSGREKEISVGWISSWTSCGWWRKKIVFFYEETQKILLKWLQEFCLWHTSYLKCIAPNSRVLPVLCIERLIQFQFRGKNKTYWVFTVVLCSKCVLYTEAFELMIQCSSALKLWYLQG